MLKAHVEMEEDKFPPKIHNLKTLAERVQLIISNPLNKIFLELNKASVPTRYPEDLQRSLADFTKAYCTRILKETEKTLQWLKQHSRLSSL